LHDQKCSQQIPSGDDSKKRKSRGRVANGAGSFLREVTYRVLAKTAYSGQIPANLREASDVAGVRN
jgi:hypothetical protein